MTSALTPDPLEVVVDGIGEVLEEGVVVLLGRPEHDGPQRVGHRGLDQRAKVKGGAVLEVVDDLDEVVDLLLDLLAHHVVVQGAHLAQDGVGHGALLLPFLP